MSQAKTGTADLPKEPSRPATRDWNGDPIGPAWLLFVVGWVFAGTTLERVASGDATGPSSAAGVFPHEPAPLDLQSSPARDLRRLPGIGPARAAAIVDWRWQRADEELQLQEIPGIGPITEAKVLDSLESEGSL